MPKPYLTVYKVQSLIAKPMKSTVGGGVGGGVGGDIQHTHRVKVYEQQYTHISSNEAGSCRQHAPNGVPIRP